MSLVISNSGIPKSVRVGRTLFSNRSCFCLRPSVLLATGKKQVCYATMKNRLSIWRPKNVQELWTDLDYIWTVQWDGMDT